MRMHNMYMHMYSRLRVREARRAASAGWALQGMVTNQDSKGLKTCRAPHLKECLPPARDPTWHALATPRHLESTVCIRCTSHGRPAAAMSPIQNSRIGALERT